tara:strand:+ start:7332 stop:7574 length:243 start_codon:yes stop_codon:yes gene_type:complete
MEDSGYRWYFFYNGQIVSQAWIAARLFCNRHLLRWEEIVRTGAGLLLNKKQPVVTMNRRDKSLVSQKVMEMCNNSMAFYT